MTEATTTVAPYSPKRPRARRVAKGEPFVWLSGGAMISGIVMIALLVGLIVYEGSRTFWPRDIELLALGSSRYTLSTLDGKAAYLDNRDQLLLPTDNGFAYADGKAYPAESPAPRKATIADFRRDAKVFAGRDWQLIDAKGQPLLDSDKKPVSPQAFVKDAAAYASPYRIADEDGKFVPAEKFLGDDKLRDHVLIMGTVRADRPLDLRDLPHKADGSPWQAYEIGAEPTELLVRQGNKGEGLIADNQYFRWIKSRVPDEDGYRRGNPGGWDDYLIAKGRPSFTCEIERLEKGALCGYVIQVHDGDRVLADVSKDGLERTWEVFLEQQERMRAEYLHRVELEKDGIGDVNAEMKDLELSIARMRYDYRKSGEMVTALEKLENAYTAWSRLEPQANPDTREDAYRKDREAWRKTLDDALAQWRKEIAGYKLDEDALESLDEAEQAQGRRADLQSGRYADLRFEVNKMREHEKRVTYVLQALDGKTAKLQMAQVVRAFRPNELGVFGKLGVYFSRVWEFLTEDPRESNTEGGIFPVIIGTLIMTLLMALAVVPFGVIAALFLREYAKQGPLVSIVRIAVNNLAGVPSIVFGIFGLGFFCVMAGGKIDDVFYPERLPNPTFGGGGVMWASLTLALMTVPVVIVATEEALLAVPSSQREASLAAGASRFQTVWRVILPQAMPGILTGTILAMARGAGEVAPLMLVGAVKLAASLPVDGQPPFVHLERKFMHLGFHIYDVGFQSPDVDSTKPLVFTTTLVLIALVAVLNIAAIRLRNRIRSKLASSHV